MLCYEIRITPTHFQGALPHRHEQTELVLTLQGGGTDIIEGERVPFAPGELVLIPPGVLHARETDGEGYQDAFLKISGQRAVQGLRGRVFRDDANHTLEKLFSAAYGIYHGDLPQRQAITDGIAETICSILRAKEGAKSVSSVTDWMRNEILLHYADPEFRIGQALQRSGYCPDHARRAFVRDMGQTPSEYLESVRLQSATELLTQRRSPLHSVGEIAQLSGYFDANYFSRAFRKHWGKSPSEYRRQMLEGEDGNDL